MSLADELVGAGLGYVRGRLDEVRTAILGDVAAFAQAAGVPGFDDAAGVVAARLTTARSELDLAAADLAARNLVSCATHVGNALAAMDQAADAVGGTTLSQLLLDAADWAGATPTGLAKQLGLPATVPGLAPDGDSLVYTLNAPGKALSPAPLRLGYTGTRLTARLRFDGAAPLFSLSLALDGLEAGIGADLEELLGGARARSTPTSCSAPTPPTGSPSPAAPAPASYCPRGRRSGPLDLREIALELPAGVADAIDIGSTINASLGDAVKAVVDGSGLHLRFDLAAIDDGDNPLDVELKRPTGIGLTLDAGIVRGGGFLQPHRRLRRRAATAPRAGRGQGGRPAHPRPAASRSSSSCRSSSCRRST